MHKAIKYTLMSAAISVIGMTALAKFTPGIPPVYTPQTDAEKSSAWTATAPGKALKEYEQRVPGNKMRSLMQEDGIINCRPDFLIGINGVSQSSLKMAFAPPMRIPGGSNICGVISYNEQNLKPGVYRLPIKSGQSLDFLNDISSLVYQFHGGAANERYMVMSYYGKTIQNGEYLCMSAIFDLNTWSLLAEAGDYGKYERVCTDMTYDPVTDRFYGCFLNRSQSQWQLAYMQMDHTNPAATINTIVPLCDLEVSLNGLAADAEGVLWGIRNDNGNLVTINKKTGEMTKVAATNFVPGYNGSLTCDNTHNLLYWSVTYDDSSSPSGISSALLTVDKATGTLSNVYKFAAPTQTCGLYSEFTAADTAPGAFSNLKVNFEGESLAGSISYDAPEGLSDGSSASGTLNYTLTVVKDNGYVAHKKDYVCNYGEKNISTPLEFKSAGDYTFTLQASNESGVGFPMSIISYVGKDLPKPVENIVIEDKGTSVNVKWDNVTETMHGGYFDPEKVTYTVSLRMFDENGNETGFPSVTVDTNSASWDVAAHEGLTGFIASVTPIFDINEGETTVTPCQWYGALTAPFEQTMRADVDGWTTTVAGNGSAWVKKFVSNGSGWSIEYNWGTTNDAWLISPAIYLEKGRYYTLSFKTWSPVVTQTLKVWMGREASPEGMTDKVADATVQGRTSKTSPCLTTFGYECQETGIYYLGIHNNTKSDTYTNVPEMWINDVTCEVAPDAAPSAPQLVVDYDKTGEFKADVTITAPTTTYSNKPLSTIEKVALKVNGAVVSEWENVEPGAELTFEYTSTKKGTYTFIAVATNEGLEGVPSIKNYYLGMSLPVDPAWVNSLEGNTPGEVNVTWGPVSKAANGQDIDPEVVTYNVMNLVTNSYVERKVSGTEYTYQACAPDKQTAILISVNAETSAGTSSTYGTRSNQSIMHVGTSYPLPVRETFADGYAHYSWSVVNQHSAYDYIRTLNIESSLGVMDANGDGYCLEAFVPYADSECSLYSGRIEIPADANNPVLGFAVYRRYYEGSNDNANTLQVGVIGNKTQGYLRPVRYGDQNYGWQYYYYDMSTFKGQTVNLLLTFGTHAYTTHYIDDIHFFDAKSKDMAISMVTVPELTLPGQMAEMGVSIINLGTTATNSKEATLEVYRGSSETPIKTSPIPAVGPFQTTVIKLTDRLNNSFDSKVPYRFVIRCDGDEDETNNSSDATLNLKLPTLPEPQALTAERNDDGYASLSWEAPDLTPTYPQFEIGFETSVEPSATMLEGFKSYDMDRNPVDTELGISGYCGFATFYHPNLAHSGSWMLISPCNANGAAKEDWLVSPKLSGSAQTVSFYARTNWNAYETYSILTSETGDSPEDFTTTVREITTTSNDWNLIEFDVPEGVRYFAIVCKAESTENLIYLMLDDFRFVGADENEGLVLEGYNTYRDNTLIEEIAPDLTWDDNKSNTGPHFYRVTARYDERGESGPSNEFFIFTRGTGVDGIAATLGKVYSRPGRIIVEGAEGCKLTVSDLNGINVASLARASEVETIEVASGVYVVSIDGASVKINVR